MASGARHLTPVSESNPISQIAPLLAAIVGGLIASVANYVFGQRMEVSKYQKGLRNTAYTDFIKGIATLSIGQQGNYQEKESEGSALIADARIRISICGSRAVASAVAALFRDGGDLKTQKSRQLLIELITLMRKEASSGEGPLTAEDVAYILFGSHDT